MKYVIFVSVFLISITLVMFFWLRSGGETGPAKIGEADKTSLSSEEKLTDEEKMQIDTVRAVIKTAKGDITLNLYPKVAPKTVDNFIKLAESGFYAGTTFHRVVPSFVIQGGDHCSKDKSCPSGTGDPGYKFADEINPKVLGLTEALIAALKDQGYVYSDSLPSMQVKVGTIAMANSGPNTNGSQFFIVTTQDQPHLNGKHTVFGEVMAGMDIVRLVAEGDVIKEITIER